MTLDSHIDAYLRDRVRLHRIKPTTAVDLSYTLRGFSRSFGNRPVRQLGTPAVEDWLASIGHLSVSTRRNYLSRVRDFTRWLVRRGTIRRDPCGDLEPIRKPRTLPRAIDHASVARLLLALPDNRARAVVWLMVGCGLRCIEVARLAVGDYDPRAGTITVRGKFDHERLLPVPVLVAAALDTYLTEQGSRPGPLIRNVDQPWKGLSPKTISGYLRGWMRAAGVKSTALDGIGAHALRHTAASDVLDRGADLRIVQQMLGHANVATTSIYLRRVKLEPMRDAMEGRDYLAAA